MPALEIMRPVASFIYRHQLPGSCSAQPGRSDLTGASESGADAEATQIPVSESIRDTFTDDVPMSYPSKYMVIGFVVRGCLIILVSGAIREVWDMVRKLQ